jgi:dihydroorotate dehydrogenase (NAD+) catalytic subunit
LVSGRVYSPIIKPMVLRMVGQLMRRITDVPIIGAGGIHTLQDARDYLEAGAAAVQVDSITWIQPKMLEFIARDLGDKTVTRETGAFPDEWYEGMGETTRNKRRRGMSQRE